MPTSDPTHFDDWQITDLACARCSLHWQASYSAKYRAAHPAGAAIACPECFSRFGVHPAKPITTSPHVIKAFPPRQLADWPKTAEGRFICTPQHPMPTDSPGKWVHPNAKPYPKLTGQCLCPDCGLVFPAPCD